MPEEYFVRDYMSSPVTSVPQTTKLLDAALMLRRSGFRHLPIVEGERLVGIISDRDVSRLTPSMLGKVSPEEYNAIFEETSLERVMTRDPITVSPETPLREAAAILQQKKVGCLPVVQDGQLVGIITVADMLGALYRLLGGVVTSHFELPGI